jgi:hypothetical protein
MTSLNPMIVSHEYIFNLFYYMWGLIYQLSSGSSDVFLQFIFSFYLMVRALLSFKLGVVCDKVAHLLPIYFSWLQMGFVTYPIPIEVHYLRKYP